MCAEKLWKKISGICGIPTMLALWLISNVSVPVHGHAQTIPDSIQWGTCPPPPAGIPAGTQQCATLSLPLDYQAPNGQTIQVTISRIQATNSSLRRGVLLLNPGGPGGAGLDLPREYSILMPQSVTDQYDLIGFDPRGVGRSSPLTCGLTVLQTEEAFTPIEQPGGFSATTAFVQNVANKCAASGGAVLPFITTANTVRDMDQIRQALGESKISYLGYSYGTYLGAVYSSLFPDKTDRFVLDSSIDPNWVWRQQFREWGPGGEVRFPDLANFVAANDGTYHLGQSPIGIYALYYQLLDYLYQNPITFSDGSVLNGPLFRELVFGCLYSDADFAPLAALWQALETPSNLAAIQQAFEVLNPPSTPVLGVPVDNLAASGLAVTCGDVAWSRSIDQYQSEFDSDRLQFPLFGALGSNVWPCAFWPNPPQELPIAITSNGPANILIVQDLRDPAAPYWGALEMHQALGQRSRMISIDQGGHGAYLLKPNICANDTTTAFLANGIYPATDVFCPANTTSTNVEGPALQNGETAIREIMKQMKHF
jgi:pimeloyl-ACP methyl ester carboxylesterase